MIKTFNEAISYLESLIPRGEKRKYPGEIGLLRQKHLLRLLGSPQEKYPCVHITGTAGKGSTAYLVSSILKEAGYKVGLHISPHLEIITERTQINNKNLSREKFVRLVNQVCPAIKRVSQNPRFGKPTYFEVLVALTFLAFAKEKVDVAVVEVGMGGKFDGTNILKSPLISIITNVGLDHTKILGGTVEQIANDKKEIVKENSIVVSGVKQKAVRKIIIKKCQAQKSKLYLINRDFKCQIKQIDGKGEIFDFQIKKKSYKDLKLSLLGFHQVENASLALAAVERLKSERFKIDERHVRKALSSAFFPGRLEVIKKKPLLVFDGAHNEDKMDALVKSFPKLFTYRKLSVVLALKRDKNIKTIFPALAKIVSCFVITRFTIGCDLGLNLSYSPKKLASIIKKELKFKNLRINTSPTEALKQALKMQREDDALLVTGSLYLVGELKQKLRELKVLGK